MIINALFSARSYLIMIINLEECAEALRVQQPICSTWEWKLQVLFAIAKDYDRPNFRRPRLNGKWLKIPIPNTFEPVRVLCFTSPPHLPAYMTSLVSCGWVVDGMGFPAMLSIA